MKMRIYRFKKKIRKKCTNINETNGQKRVMDINKKISRLKEDKEINIKKVMTERKIKKKK